MDTKELECRITRLEQMLTRLLEAQIDVLDAIGIEDKHDCEKVLFDDMIAIKKHIDDNNDLIALYGH